MGEILNLIESVSGGFPSYFFNSLSGVFTLECLVSRKKLVNFQLSGSFPEDRIPKQSGNFR